MADFFYGEAFSRNLGWVTEWEQQILRHKRVAIVGMGGVGGTYLTALARLGIENFHIAEFDYFELANFNRQVGATMDTIDQPKIDVMEKMARAINPDLRVTSFREGVTPENVGRFNADYSISVLSQKPRKDTRATPNISYRSRSDLFGDI